MDQFVLSGLERFAPDPYAEAVPQRHCPQHSYLTLPDQDANASEVYPHVWPLLVDERYSAASGQTFVELAFRWFRCPGSTR